MISQNSAAHSPITEGNTAAPGGGRRTLSVPLIKPSLQQHQHTSDSALCRTFGATLTISRVRVWDFPVQLAAFFVESLQDLPHFFCPASAAQFQVLPVQLQGAAGVLYAVMGFPLNVEVWESHKERDLVFFPPTSREFKDLKELLREMCL